MAYTKTNWVDGNTPLSAANMNKIEDRIASASGNTSYIAFCANVNVASIDAAFGKNNESEMNSIGLQMAMYAWFKGDSKTTYPFTNLILCDTLSDVAGNNDAKLEISGNLNLFLLCSTSTYASSILAGLKFYLYREGTEYAPIGCTWTTGGGTGGSGGAAYSAVKNAGNVALSSVGGSGSGNPYYSSAGMCTADLGFSIPSAAKIIVDGAMSAGGTISNATWGIGTGAGTFSFYLDTDVTTKVTKTPATSARTLYSFTGLSVAAGIHLYVWTRTTTSSSINLTVYNVYLEL